MRTTVLATPRSIVLPGAVTKMGVTRQEPRLALSNALSHEQRGSAGQTRTVTARMYFVHERPIFIESHIK